MAEHGGKRPGAGRPAGSRNRRTKEQIAAAAAGVLPLDYLLTIMRDPEQKPADRMTAAISAAPYVHPKLATTTLKGDADAPVSLELKGSDVHG
jgi:hypothetical protein